MTKLGRNDPCSCGSGKKYKKCCLISFEAAESQYRRLHEVGSRLIPRLFDHAFDTFGGDSLGEAWADFNGDADDDLEADDEYYEVPDPASPMNVLFMPWFLYCWVTFTMGDAGGSIPEETTIAESFIRSHRNTLTQEEISFLASAIRCRFTFCEVLDVKPGEGIKQFDLLRRLEFDVTEHSASQSLRRGDIIYCAISELGDITSNVATGPYALRPITKKDVLDLRDWILEDSGSEEITDEHLLQYEPDIRNLYLDTVDLMLDPHPDIRNTDNDQMRPQQLCFEIVSADKAFHALKDLAEGVDETDLLEDAKLSDGLVRRVEIPWIGGNEAARKRLAGNVLLGNIKIEDRVMTVEVNSDERAELIRNLIEDRLGPDATHQMTVVDPLPFLESLESGMSNATGEGTSDGVSSLMNDPPPQLLEKLAEMNRQHWDAWFDDPIPALNNMTPREAAKTERGRDLLESLLCEYAIRDAHAPANIFTPDIAALRRELGLKP